MKNNPNTSFINVIEAEAIRKRISEQAARINNALGVLMEYEEPATLEALKTYQERGFDYLREDAVKECREYIKATKMPAYLQQDAIQRAYASVNSEFLEQMREVLIGLELPEELNVLEFEGESGLYRFSSDFVKAELEKRRYTLTDAEQADFVKFKEALGLLGEIETGQACFAAFNTLVDYRLRADSSEEVVAAALKACQRKK